LKPPERPVSADHEHFTGKTEEQNLEKIIMGVCFCGFKYRRIISKVKALKPVLFVICQDR
jgi:hypothetical protein